MIVGITGHRPDKIGGYDQRSPQRLIIGRWLWEQLQELQPDKAITGMALGTDMDFAIACYGLNIPFIAAVPYINQSRRWSDESRKLYSKLLDLAADVVVISDDDVPYDLALQVRNEYVVNNCDKLIAVWDGSHGGTANCIAYADEVGRDMICVDPKELWKDMTDAGR